MQRHGKYRFILISFLVVLGFFLANYSYASQPSLFVVNNVDVDVTAESALEAKEEAFQKAQIDAFKMLMRRMVTEREMSMLGTPSISVISSLIQDFEITREKLSKVRYIGSYTFRFDEKATRDYFSNIGLGFSDVRGDPVLVLPLFRDAGKTVLWADDNPWLNAWNAAGPLDGLVPTTVPIGDLDDFKDLGDDSNLSYTAEALTSMLARYQAREAVIAIASHNADKESLNIQIFRTDRDQPEFVQTLTVREAADGNTLFAQAVKDVHFALQRDWKEKTRVAMDEHNQITARVPIENIRQWADTQKIIRGISAIEEFSVKSLSPSAAIITLDFQGRPQRLQAVLRDFDVTLNIPKSPVQTKKNRFFGFDDPEQEPAVYELYLNKYKPSIVN